MIVELAVMSRHEVQAGKPHRSTTILLDLQRLSKTHELCNRAYVSGQIRRKQLETNNQDASAAQAFEGVDIK